MVNNYGGTKAAETEDFDKQKAAKKNEQKTRITWWGKPVAVVVLTIIFSCSDALVLYSIMDAALTQSAVMGIVMALSVAVVLNVIPIIIAQYIHKAIYKTEKYALLLSIIFVAGFLLLFAMTVHLRFAYSDMYGQEAQMMQLENTVSDEDLYATEYRQDNTNNSKGDAVVLLLAICPLITSIINFGLAYITDDELRSRKEFLEVRKIEIKSAINELEAALAQMNRNVERDLELDKSMMLAARQDVIARGEMLKSIARCMLAQYLADPSAISKISGEIRVNNSDLVQETTEGVLIPENNSNEYIQTNNDVLRAESVA